MDLVLKISDKCNFACSFCSSNEIANNHNDLDINIVKNFLLKHGKVCNNIIVNGGDPLCTPPEWYYDLIHWLRENHLSPTISFTTNLYDFWKNPEKWEDLFKNHISVCTSFQYGDERKLKSGQVFTEEMFREIFYLFEERIGYKLKFIAVVNENNESYCNKTVKLAKELGTTCRLNPALKSGRTNEPYPFFKMIKIWLSLIELGLDKYEDNCHLLKRLWQGEITECPFNINCNSYDFGIKCISPNGQIHNCPAIADDILKEVDDAYVFNSKKLKPFSDVVIKGQCYECPCYLICNSCTKRIQDVHSMGEDWIQNYCKNMKNLIPEMQRLLS